MVFFETRTRLLLPPFEIVSYWIASLGSLSRQAGKLSSSNRRVMARTESDAMESQQLVFGQNAAKLATDCVPLVG